MVPWYHGTMVPYWYHRTRVRTPVRTRVRTMVLRRRPRRGPYAQSPACLSRHWLDQRLRGGLLFSATLEYIHTHVNLHSAEATKLGCAVVQTTKLGCKSKRSAFGLVDRGATQPAIAGNSLIDETNQESESGLSATTATMKTLRCAFQTQSCEAVLHR